MPSIRFDGRARDARDDFAYRRNLILLFFFADIVYWAIVLNFLSPQLYAQVMSPFPFAYGGPDVVVSGLIIANVPFVTVLAAIYLLKIPEREIASWFMWILIAKVLGSVTAFLVQFVLITL
jgi:hypothetical protein